MKHSKQAWGSQLGLILATAGGAVGLGNFLRFPAQIIKNGGSSFIIPYIVCFFVIGLPLLLIEWSIGRMGSEAKKHSLPFILDTLGKGKYWKYVGAIGIFSNLIIIAYYCYIESWTISYMFDSLMGTFSDMDQTEVVNFFGKYVTIFSDLGINYKPIIFYLICIALNIYILSKGIKGIEKTAKIAMPFLLIFGLILAFKGWTLGNAGASENHPSASAWEGLNFIWSVQFDSIWNPKVWMAAAGHIFFSVSVGMGIIHCYASYIGRKEDIALNAFSSGFINIFIEITLGSAIVIPIAAGYLGLDWVKENAGFGMAFQTMPYLFERWGGVLTILGGVIWFGLLFFAGLTSSLSVGAPWMALIEDEFKWSRKKAAYLLGAIILFVGLPCVFYLQYGFLDEYDYWAGTLSVFLLAFFEVILFVWFFGIEKGWSEITNGANIKVPYWMKYIIKYVTPYLLFIIFLGVIITPIDNNWVQAFSNLFSKWTWVLDDSSLIKKITQSNTYTQIAQELDPVKKLKLEKNLFYTYLSRGILLILFIFVCLLIYFASKKNKKS